MLARRAIPDPLWRLTLARVPFLAERSAQDLDELRRLSSLFLDEKEFTGGGGLVVDDAMAVCIAAQACRRRTTPRFCQMRASPDATSSAFS